MMLRVASLALAIPLLACSEAQMCRNAAMAPLNTLDRQIRDSERNIARGYEVIEAGTVPVPRRICRPVRGPAPPPASPPPANPPPTGPPPTDPAPPGAAPADPTPAVPPPASPSPEIAPPEGPPPEGPPPKGPPSRDLPSASPATDTDAALDAAGGLAGERLATRSGDPVRCRIVYDDEPRYIHRSINIQAEAAKLASLRAQRVQLLPLVEARLAQCPAG